MRLASGLWGRVPIKKPAFCAGFVDVLGYYPTTQMVGRGLTKNPRNPLIALWYLKSKHGSCPRSCPSRLNKGVALIRSHICLESRFMWG
jgi:hypothetical protein